MAPPLVAIGQVDAMLKRPFRQMVDLELVFLLLAFLLVAAGAWHMVVERLEL